MTERTHVHVTRIKHKDSYSDRRSLQLPYVVRQPHGDGRRTWQSQCTVPRKIISPSDGIQYYDQRSKDANKTIQSISVILFDSSRTNRLKPVYDTTSIPLGSINRNSLNIPVFRQSRQSKFDASTNHSKSNSQNIPLDHVQIIGQRSNRKEWPGVSREHYRKKKQRFCESYCACSFICKLLLLISLILLAAIIAGVLTLVLVLKDTTTITTTVITITTTSSCRPSCTSEQNCVNGLCVNVGYLACTLTWSRPGDGDIVVTTPNNRTISYQNRGPSVNTDGGQLDIDDQNGVGPENVYWISSGTLPPTGVYHVCFEPYTILPLISPTNPITVVYRIIRPLNNIMIFTQTFTSLLQNSYNCDSNSPTLIGSFTYP